MLRRASLVALVASVVAHGVLLKAADRGFSVPPSPPLPEMALVDVIIPPAEPVKLAMAIPEPPPAATAVAPQPAPEPQAPAAPRPKARPKPRPEPPAVPAPVPEASIAAAEPASEAEAPAPDPALHEEDLAALAVRAPGAAARGDAAAEPATPAEEADSGPAADPALDPRALDLSAWPASGSIVYRVMYGEGGFQVGEARHRWSHDGERYEMETALQTTGITALFRNFHYVQRSVGGLGKAGLRPERFSVEQAGRKPEWADFDWEAGQVTIQRKKGQRTAAIQPGDQDVLSLWHQIGIVGVEGLPLELTVVSNKAASPSQLAVVGVETANLPIGSLDTLHLHAQAKDGGLAIDIWLARRYGMLPVRIRVIDDKGERFDQQAVLLRLAPPPGETGGDAAETRIVELREQHDPFTLYK